MNALYHLVSDGTDSSAGATTTTIDPSNSAIIYSPFNWNVVTGMASSVNSGAYFRVIFSGARVQLSTDTSPDTSPYSQLWARVDNQGWQLFTLTAGNPTLTIASGLDTSKDHMLEVVVKATSITLNRWTSSQTIVQITGIVLDPFATVKAPIRRTKNVLIYGDSITEGRGPYGDVLTPATACTDILGC